MRFVLAIALILTTAIGLAWYRSSTLQADLVEAVEAALVAADAEEVLVSVDGLEVTLAGVVSDPATKERIESAVAGLPRMGGRFVNAIEVAAADPPQEAAEASPGAALPADSEDAVSEAPLDVAQAAGGAVGRQDDPVSREDCQVEIDAVLGGRSIDFASSSVELEPRSTPLLDDLVAVLLRCGEARIEIAGHTDASGPRKDNLELSLQRAETVKAYMLAGGVVGEQMTAVGYGPDLPLVDNATPEGRAQNRRIEVKVLNP